MNSVDATEITAPQTLIELGSRGHLQMETSAACYTCIARWVGVTSSFHLRKSRPRILRERHVVKGLNDDD